MSLGGVAKDINDTLGATPTVAVTLPDLFDLTTLNVDTTDADLGGLLDFSKFGFSDVLVLLNQVVDFLSDFTELDFLSKPLPLIDVTLVDVLDVVQDFTDAVQDITNNPTSTVQNLLDRLEEGLQQFPVFDVSLAYGKSGAGVLEFGLEFERSCEFCAAEPELGRSRRRYHFRLSPARRPDYALGSSRSDGQFWSYDEPGIRH